jgi:Fur family ferric uptake transcriptional regulator
MPCFFGSGRRASETASRACPRGGELRYLPRVTMAAGLAETKRRLRDLGLRVTAPRVGVLRVLDAAERPLSHAEVVSQLGGDAAEDAALWDRATVYRNLVALVGVGLVRISSHAGGICRYEIVKDPKDCTHPHFVCDDCGIVSCLPEAEVVTKQNTAWSKSLSGAEVQFVGRCPSCST